MAAASGSRKTQQLQATSLTNKSKREIYGKRQSKIGSSNKGHAFAEYRKLRVLNQYKKYKHQQKRRPEGKEEENGINSSFQTSKRPFKRKNKYQTAEFEFRKRKAEKERLKKEIEESRRKRKEEFEENQLKRRETHRKLKRKTTRGQPVLSNHIEHLLEKIERR